MKQLLPSERVAIVGVIDPDANSANTYTTDWIAMSDFPYIMAVVMSGLLGSGATLDAKLEQASDAAGTGAKDIVGAVITQLTKAASDDDKQVVIQCHAEDLDLVNAFTHVRLSLTVAGATSDSGAIVLGMDGRYLPASNRNLTSVAEIVTV